MIEPLEARIAPASLTGKILSYTDADGDMVTITFTTKGPLALSNFVFTNLGADHEQLQTIDLTSALFAGTSLTMKVTAAGGDGVADVGYIKATGVDLGKITLLGDLGRIDAGDADSTPAVNTLAVGSLGKEGITTQEAGGSLVSNLLGSLSTLKVTGDIEDAFLDITGGAVPKLGKLGKATIGGSLIGGTDEQSGSIHTTGNIGSVTILGGIQGGTGNDSGLIRADGKLSSVMVTGSIVGSTGIYSGFIYAVGNIGKVIVNGDIVGGDALRKSGGIESNKGGLGSLKILGSLTGGAGDDSGEIDIALNTKSITINGNINGDAGGDAGLIEAHGNVGSIKIGGSIIGGDGLYAGGIYVEGKLGKVTVVQDVLGGGGYSSGEIFATNNPKDPSFTPKFLGQIGTVIIGGNLEGGTGKDTGIVFADTKIKSVTVGGYVKGADGEFSGYIGAKTTLGTVKINGGDLTGGAGNQSGLIYAGVMLKSVTINGSIISGTGLFSGGIDGDGFVGKLDVKQNITGTELNPVYVLGSLNLQNAKTGVRITGAAIKTIKVGGNVTFTNILAGYNDTTPFMGTLTVEPLRGDVSIGSVTILGNFTASNIVAGVNDVGLNGFGNADDATIADTNAKFISSIGKIAIGTKKLPATVNGTVGGTDHFGITAEYVKGIKINGIAAVLTKKAHNDNRDVPTATTADFTIRET